jgi:hypothetical protein
MQSLAYGTPVITHDDHKAQGPEWEAILPGHTGDFFRRGDVSDLARVIQLWTRRPLPDPAARRACHQLIERFYNPVFQRRAIDRAVRGLPADDLFWLREGGTEAAALMTPSSQRVGGASEAFAVPANRRPPLPRLLSPQATETPTSTVTVGCQ